MKTPLQNLIINLDKLIKDEVDYGGDYEIPFEVARYKCIELLEYEENKMKEMFVSGIMKGKQNTDFDLDE